MAIFGLSTKKEVEAQIEAFKAAMFPDLQRWLMETADVERWNLGDPSTFNDPLTLYRKLSWILQAVDNTASAGALARFDVKRIVQDKEPKDIPNHPFEQLLRRPNPLDSRYDLLYATIAMFKLTGNAYWWLNRADENSPPDEIWLMPSNQIIPVLRMSDVYEGYMYYPGNGREILLPPHEIVHFRRMNPFSRFLGLSAVESIALLAKGDIAMQQWNTTLFGEKNGMLPGILAFEQMVADPTWSKIKEDTKDAQKNRSLLMLRGVGAGVSAKGGVSWLQNNVSQKDMEFLEGRKATGKEIMDTLAPGLYTWLSGESTYSNAGAARAAFNELTLYPMHVMMAEQITNKILPSYGGRPLIGEFEDLRFADKEMEAREQEQYALTHTVEEVREKYYGDEPLGDERDKLLVAQINAQSGGIQEPPPPPVMKPPAGPEGAVPPAEGAQPPAPEADIKPKEEANKAVLDELAKWERKAVKRVGKAVEFVTGVIPSEIIERIETTLPTCKTETAVKMLFESVRAGMKASVHLPTVHTTGSYSVGKWTPQTYSGADLRYLADSLNTLAAKYAAPTQAMPNIYLQQPSQTFNLPTLDPSFTVNMPGQDAPNTYVNITPTIEAAKAPDVRVDSPVTIHQTVEPAPAPQITTPININQTIEPGEAPQVTFAPVIEPTAVTNEINFSPTIQPAESAVQVNVEPTPIKFDPTIAAPEVNIVNEIKTPKMKRSKDKVERDGDGNISGKSTDYEYEDDK